MPTPKKTTLRSDPKSVKIHVPCKRCFLVIRLPQNMESPEKNQDVREFSAEQWVFPTKKNMLRKTDEAELNVPGTAYVLDVLHLQKKRRSLQFFKCISIPSILGKKTTGFSEAKKPSFQLKNFGMSKKNHRLDVAVSWTAGLIWVEQQARQGGQYLHHLQWFQNAPNEEPTPKGGLPKQPIPSPSTLLSLARFSNPGGKGGWWIRPIFHWTNFQ